MIKKFGVFWLSQKSDTWGDDSFYALGSLRGIHDTESEAIFQIETMYPESENDLFAIIPVYSNAKIEK
jgi:hypothetical protein